jgi:hypothetical protein
MAKEKGNNTINRKRKFKSITNRRKKRKPNPPPPPPKRIITSFFDTDPNDYESPYDELNNVFGNKMILLITDKNDNSIIDKERHLPLIIRSPKKNKTNNDKVLTELFKKIITKNINNTDNNTDSNSDTNSVDSFDENSFNSEEFDFLDEKLVPECENPLCNHLSYKEDPTEPSSIDIEKVKNIDDLILLGKSYHCQKRKLFNNLNLRIMCKLVEPLTELNDMIGMKNVKEHIVDQILFFLQGFNTIDKCNKCKDCTFDLPCIQTNTEMLHTVITGPPGVGKTCVARILGKIYKAMGILSTGKFNEVSRSDFVAKYLGQTAIKTQRLIDECRGGVMFIDEAYSLGHKEKRDSFAKEALDTLNKNLTDEKDLLCIIAGYEKDLDKCFFSMNQGLKRRFTFRYNIKEYDYKELLEIFKLKVKSENWSFNTDSLDEDENCTDEKLIAIFRKNKEYFPYCGGDVETLFLQCKISHGRRLPYNKKCFNIDDIEEGFKIFIKNRKYKDRKPKDDDRRRPSMYSY